jgi:hypothetical protein
MILFLLRNFFFSVETGSAVYWAIRAGKLKPNPRQVTMIAMYCSVKKIVISLFNNTLVYSS